MKRATWIASLLVLLLVIGGTVLFRSTYQQVTREEQVDRTGEAAYNPLYALKLALQAQGKTVQSRAVLGKLELEQNAVVVLRNDIEALRAEEIEKLQEFAINGGRVLFSMPNPGSDSDLLADVGDIEDLHACRNFNPVAESALRDVFSSLRALFGAGSAAERLPQDPDAKGENARTDDSPISSSNAYSAQFCTNRGLRLSKYYDEDSEGDSAILPLWQFADEAAHAQNGGSGLHSMVRIPYGEGEYYIAGALEFLDTDSLQSAQMQALSAYFLSPWQDAQHWYLIYDSRVTPWYVWLLEKTWPILLPLLLAFFAWLWRKQQSLGPAIELQSVHRNALHEHLQASGEFMATHQLTVRLLNDLRERVYARLRRKDPGLAQLDEREFIQQLLTRTELDRSEANLLLQLSELARTAERSRAEGPKPESKLDKILSWFGNRREPLQEQQVVTLARTLQRLNLAQPPRNTANAARQTDPPTLAPSFTDANARPIPSLPSVPPKS